jgi:hypothetical protein
MDNVTMQNNNTSDILKSLEELYLAKEYGAARKLLLESRDKLEPDLFHYNIGTIDAKNGEWGISRFHLEKALKSGFFDLRADHNLEYVKGKLQLQGLSSSVKLQDRLLDKAMSVNPALFHTTSLILILLLLLFIKRKIIKRAFVIILWLTISIVPVVAERLFLANISSAIVLQAAPRYEGPSAIFDKLSKISVGSKIIIREHDETWALVLAPYGLVGWVKREQLGVY